MKMKNKILAVSAMNICLLFSQMQLPVQASDYYENVMTYTTENKNEQKPMDKEIQKNGKKYELKGISYEIVEETPEIEKKKVMLEQQSGAILKGTTFEFPKEIKKDEVVYQLKEVKEEEAEAYRQGVESYTEYEYVVSENNVPKTKTVSAKNEKTGVEETVECTLNRVHMTHTKWVDSTIDITFQGYDRNAIEWEGIVFPNDRGAGAPLKGYETQLLASVGLDNSNGKIQNTYYTSDMYTDADGVVCRNAQADIQKLVPVYRAEYIGEINTPYVIKTALYEGEQEVANKENVSYVIEATGRYEEVQSPIVAISVGIAIIILLIVLILYVLAKKKKKEETKEIHEIKEKS